MIINTLTTEMLSTTHVGGLYLSQWRCQHFFNRETDDFDEQLMQDEEMLQSVPK